MFNVDLDKLINWLTPALLRKPKMFAWMRSLCAGLYSLYTEFMNKRDQDLYELSHDSRVFSMEAVLNDAFDYADRRIYITDGFTKERVYIYTPDEDKPLYLDEPVYLYNPEDYFDTGVDFVVWVPTLVALTAQGMILLKALVNKYKLAGKRYAIYRVTL